MAIVQSMSTVQIPAQAKPLLPCCHDLVESPIQLRSSVAFIPSRRSCLLHSPSHLRGLLRESLTSPEPVHQFAQSRSYSSSSIASQSSLSASPYGSKDPSVLFLDESEASTSSVSPATSTSAHGATSSSHGHSNSQSSSRRPARLSKSWVRRKSMAAAQEHGDASKNVTEAFVTPPARARTVSHGHSRPASFPVVPVAATTTMPPAYSRTSQPHPESISIKQPPSVSRDPTSNWVSS
ncbi:hypothetical protein JVU11DRAFT_6045 [Chiua virens]|nr:hypothetical protein JVU11DRAFT_6045 [Chiua virens]